MNALYSLAAVLLLVALALVGGQAAGLRTLFGVILPYAAIATFLLGLAYRVIQWARSPVPFRIPTTCGQQKSLPWIKGGWLESPFTTLGVIARMALGDPSVPLPVPQYQGGAPRRPQADLRGTEVPLAGRAGLSLVLPRHFSPAPAFLPGAHPRLCPRPSGVGRLLPGRRTRPLPHRRRHPGGPGLSPAEEVEGPADPLHLPVHRLFRPFPPARPCHLWRPGCAISPRSTWWTSSTSPWAW